MKKLLFAAGIFSFCFISAQQNPFVVPQKPLLKKYTPKYYENKLNDSLSALRWKKSLTDTQFLHRFMYHAPQAKLQFVLPDSTKVYSLPLDNMFCLVPDMNQFNMPNAAIPDARIRNFLKINPEYKNFPGKIPNVVVPYEIIPQRKDTPTQ